MAFEQTTAQNMPELLEKVKTFAVGAGFNLDYDEIAGASGGFGLTKGNTKVVLRWDGITTTHDQEITGGQIEDAELLMGLSATTTTRIKRVDDIYCNDLAGPFANVWLFTPKDLSAVFCVAQTGLKRYTHFGFGALENPASNTPCAFAMGQRYIFWEKDSDEITCNDFANTWHYLFTDGESKSPLSVYVPDGVLDPVYFPRRSNAVYKGNKLQKLLARGETNPRKLMDVGNDKPYWLNYFGIVQNFNTTGGVPLLSVPVILSLKSTQKAWLGELPDYRLVDVSNIAPGESVKYGADEWLCFPLVQKGLLENAHKGKKMTPDPNTLGRGIAIRKNV